MAVKKPAKSKAFSKKNLPEWDLSDLYKGLDDSAIKRDLRAVEKQASAFAKAYQGQLKTAHAKTLVNAVKAYEKLQDLSGKLGSYAQLVYASNMNDPAHTSFYQNTQESLNEALNVTVFFTLELNAITGKKLYDLAAKSPALKRYMPWIAQLRLFKPYQLSNALESYIQKQQVSEQSWQRLFDETIARQKFKVKNKTYNSAEIFDFLSGKDAALRKLAAKDVARVYAQDAPIFTLITNTLAKSKAVEDTERKLPAPISSRNLANHVEDDVVDALVGTVRGNYKNLSHRYYKWKAKQFGKRKLDYWDRNAPLPGAADQNITWHTAQKKVLKAYGDFSPELAKIGEVFFDKNWIDAKVTPGKAPGAFAHPVVPSAHPYLLVNYQGKTRDVMTLAHELGHGVHQVLSAKQGALMCDTPLTLAETASVFGEMLTFKSLLAAEKNTARRQYLIASKIEDMLNTVVRQTAFCDFELRLHDARKQGELSTAAIGKIWMDVQAESLGPAIKLSPEYHVYWMYIPHFIHTPFYVYAYAFGDCLVNALYHVYEEQNAKGQGDIFVKKYIAMLKAGGTLAHKELLKPFGLDASRADFWQRGLDVISGYIDLLED
jgi:oligoendopeptidase F